MWEQDYILLDCGYVGMPFFHIELNLSCLLQGFGMCPMEIEVIKEILTDYSEIQAKTDTD